MKVLIVNDEAQDDLIGRLKDAGFDGCILAASLSLRAHPCWTSLELRIGIELKNS